MLFNRRRTVKVMFLTGIICLVIGLGAPLLPLRLGTAQTEPPLVELNEDVIKRATVFLMQTYTGAGETIMSCVGSGTLVSADGLILTNAHTVTPSEICPADRLIVAVTVRLDEPPIPTYTASILDSSQGLDLAVLRIDGYLDGRVIEPGTLQLPFVELGDSGAVALDDTITVVGYPDIGNDPVGVARGTVSGFTAEAHAGERAWIRTEATIPGVMSGGGAYSRDGKLIGIPTIAPARAGGEAVDCRVLQDSNGDGRADDNDSCVPVGGFISALRPSALARGLVRGAALGIRQGEALTPSSSVPLSGPATFSRLFFTTSINEAGVPNHVAGGSVPGGINSLYLFFDYTNMVSGVVYELRVTVDNLPDATHSLPPVPWSGGRRGTWYIGSSYTPWRNGQYDFRLFIEGREVASQKLVIGGGASEAASFSDIVFGLLDDSGNLVGTNYVLPEGSAIQARFNYHNMQPGLNWTYIWYYEGQELVRDTTPWDGDVQGTRLITAAAEFLPGQYRLELYIENVLSATADFVIAGGAEISRAAIFGEFRFTTAQAGGSPAAPIRSEFPAGIESLYVFFNWRLIAPGTLWTRRWLIDDDVLFEVTEPWDATPEGQDYFLALDSLESLPDGTYGFEISMANVVLERVEVSVGLGQLPVEAFASAAGVQISGRITDAETGEGIPGAMFIVLESEFSIEDFVWTRSQVLGVSLADSRGYFQVPSLLTRGTIDDPLFYSVLVRAEGYFPMSADGVAVDTETQSPVEINAALSHY